MKTLNKSIGFSLLMCLLFVLLIMWTVTFDFLKIEDIKLFAILLIASLILILLGTKNLKDWQEVSDKLRFNLFLTAMLMGLMMVFNLMLVDTEQIRLQSFLICFKPLIFALVVYLPLINILGKLKSSVNGDHDDLKLLSRRENEVFELALTGLNNKEISELLYIAESTVKKHMQNILKKTSCDDRHMLALKYKKNV